MIQYCPIPGPMMIGRADPTAWRKQHLGRFVEVVPPDVPEVAAFGLFVRHVQALGFERVGELLLVGLSPPGRMQLFGIPNFLYETSELRSPSPANDSPIRSRREGLIPICHYRSVNNWHA